MSTTRFEAASKPWLRAASLALRLNPAAVWTIELQGGVSGLRADLRDLRVASITIQGGASDIDLDLPTPRGELAVRIEGGANKATIHRPAEIPVGVTIDGGASWLRLDKQAIGTVGGEVRLVTPPGAQRDNRVAVQILGGASRLTIETVTQAPQQPNPMSNNFERSTTMHGTTTTDLTDEAAVVDVYQQLMDGWNKGSGAAFAAAFKEDGDLVAFDGTHLKGRAEIAPFHQQLFDKWLKGTRLEGHVKDVRFLSPDVALMHAIGGTVMRGKSKPSPERDSIQTLVATRQDGEWHLAAFQNTRLRPMSGKARPFVAWTLSDWLWKLLRLNTKRTYE